MSLGRYWHWRKTPWLSAVIPAIGILMIAPGLWLLISGKGTQPIPSFLMLLGAFCIFRYWIVGIRFRRLIRKNPQYGKTLTMSFSETGFQGATEGSEIKAEWTTVYETVTTPDGFLIYPQKEIYYWVPRAGFSSETDASVVASHLHEKTKNKIRG